MLRKCRHIERQYRLVPDAHDSEKFPAVLRNIRSVVRVTGVRFRSGILTANISEKDDLRYLSPSPQQIIQRVLYQAGVLDLSVGMSDVEPIHQSCGGVAERSEIADVVEIPLLSACEELYDKNIRTTESSANIRIAGNNQAYITIDSGHLSPVNMRIATECAGYRADRISVILAKPGELRNFTIMQVIQRAENLASRFEHQNMTWAKIWTPQSLRERLSILSDFQLSDAESTPEAFVSEGYYHDRWSGLFYENEEQFQKVRESRSLGFQPLSRPER